MLPFRMEFRPGLPVFEQVVYAAKKAIVAGSLRPGDPFPSVRTLSKALKINPNTAHKVIAYLISSGLLLAEPGVGTIVAEARHGTAEEVTSLLEPYIENLVVEAKRLGAGLSEVVASLTNQWNRLSSSDQARSVAKNAAESRKA